MNAKRAYTRHLNKTSFQPSFPSCSAGLGGNSESHPLVYESQHLKLSACEKSNFHQVFVQYFRRYQTREEGRLAFAWSLDHNAPDGMLKALANFTRAQRGCTEHKNIISRKPVNITSVNASRLESCVIQQHMAQNDPPPDLKCHQNQHQNIHSPPNCTIVLQSGTALKPKAEPYLQHLINTSIHVLIANTWKNYKGR